MRIALIGATDHWHSYASALKNIPGTIVAAIAPSGPEEPLSRFDNAPGVTSETRRYQDGRELLKSERLDAVQVACRSDRIAEWVSLCFEHKTPVIAEKPLAMNLEALSRLYALCCRSSTPIIPMHTIRETGTFSAVHRVVQSGEIGEPLMVFSQKSYRWGNARPDSMRSRTTFPGTAAYVGIHAFDWLYWMLGDVFVEVSGTQGNSGHPDFPGCASQSAFTLKMKNGGAAAVTLDYLRPAAAPTHADDRVRIVGTRGVVEGFGAEKRATLITQDKPLQELKLPAEGDMISDFLRSLSSGTPPMSSYDAFRTTEIALAAQLAADTGRVVSLGEKRLSS
jgi:predicted dehydrogenase